MQYDNYFHNGPLTILTNLLNKKEERLYMKIKQLNNSEFSSESLTFKSLGSDEDDAREEPKLKLLQKRPRFHSVDDITSQILPNK